MKKRVLIASAHAYAHIMSIIQKRYLWMQHTWMIVSCKYKIIFICVHIYMIYVYIYIYILPRRTDTDADIDAKKHVSTARASARMV